MGTADAGGAARRSRRFTSRRTTARGIPLPSRRRARRLHRCAPAVRLPRPEADDDRWRRLSTHVLDTARGTAGARASRSNCTVCDGGERMLVASAVTNADGRTDAPLLSGDRIEPGIYELTFHAGDYFAQRRRHARPIRRFSTTIVIRFGIADRERPLPRAAAALALRLQHLPRLVTSDSTRRRGRSRWCRTLAACSRRARHARRGRSCRRRCATCTRA